MTKRDHLESLRKELQAILAEQNARTAAQHRLYQIAPLLLKQGRIK